MSATPKPPPNPKAKTTRRLDPEALIEQMLERRTFLAEAERSGLSGREFAREKGISRSTLYRRRKRAALGSLVDERHRRSGRHSSLDPRVLGWALAYQNSFPKAKVKQICEEARKVAAAENWPRFNYWQLLRAFNGLPSDLRETLTEGSRACFERTCLTARRSRGYPYELVQMDSCELDLWVLDVESGELFKPWMTTIIDAFSRVVLALRLHRREPTARDVLLVIRQAITPKGTPDWPFYSLFRECQRDNHPIFKALDVKDAMQRLGVIYTPIPPAAPNANGIQERFFGRWKRQFLANLVGYAGQSNALAKARQGAVPWPVLERLTQRELLKYHTTTHRELGVSPWEKLHENLDAAHGLVYDARLVHDSLKVRRTAAVERDGVTLEDGRRFSSARLTGLVGATVELRLDPEGGEQTIEAYRGGEFVGDLRPFGEALNAEVATARLERTVEFRRFRKTMRRLLKTAPPIVSHGVRIAGPAAPAAGKPRPAAGEDDGDRRGEVRPGRAVSPPISTRVPAITAEEDNDGAPRGRPAPAPPSDAGGNPGGGDLPRVPDITQEEP